MEPVTVAAVQAAPVPLTGEEGILYAEIDAGATRASRQQFDPAGHYSRSDVLRLTVDTTPRAAVSFTSHDKGGGLAPAGGPASGDGPVR
jgi:hypothetical protein